MLCVLILYISGGTNRLKSTPNDRFVKKLFIAILFTLTDFVRKLMRRNCRRYTFCILFWCLAWFSNPFFTSNKPTNFQIYCSDFNIVSSSWPSWPLHNLTKSALQYPHWVCCLNDKIVATSNTQNVQSTRQLKCQACKIILCWPVY